MGLEKKSASDGLNVNQKIAEGNHSLSENETSKGIADIFGGNLSEESTQLKFTHTFPTENSLHLSFWF